MDQDQQALPTYEEVASLIDCHLLRPAATDDDVAEACRTAVDYAVRTLVVWPSDADQAIRWAGGSGVIVSGLVGYPDGSGSTGAKLFEGRDLLRRGCKEIDWVLNAGKLRSRQFQHVETELMQIARSCLESGAKLKVLFPTEHMDSDLQIIATKISKRVEASFVIVKKTADMAIVQPVLKDRIEMKAFTVESLAELRTAQAAGCTRFGTDHPASILQEWKAELELMKSQRQAGSVIS